jgi:hypothetical protein
MLLEWIRNHRDVQGFETKCSCHVGAMCAHYGPRQKRALDKVTDRLPKDEEEP